MHESQFIPGNNQPDWHSFDPASDGSFDQREYAVRMALMDCLAGDGQARDAIRSNLRACPDVEATTLFESIQTSIESLGPGSISEPRAVLQLAGDSRSYLPDWGARLFELAAYHAQAADDAALVREAWLGRAGVCYEAENMEECRRSCIEALKLTQLREADQLGDYCSAYSLIARTYLAEHEGDRAERAGEALLTAFEEHRGEVARLLRFPRREETNLFQQLVQAHITAGDTLCYNQRFDEARELLEGTLQSLAVTQSPLLVDARVRVLLASAECWKGVAEIECYEGRGLQVEANALVEAVECLDAAVNLIESQGDSWKDRLLHGRILLSRGGIQYERCEWAEGKGDTEDALDILRELRAFGQSCEELIEEAEALIECCLVEIEDELGGGEPRDELDFEPPHEWSPES